MKRLRCSPKVIEFEDMTEEQQTIVLAGNEIAGTFPSGLTREELGAWITERFSSSNQSDHEDACGT